MKNKPNCSDHLNYYYRLLDRCWRASQHYKEGSHKLLMWIGSIFVGIIATTGIFGSEKSGEVIQTLSIFHIILLHTIFAIFWLFCLHKKLIAEMYIHIGIEAEKYISTIFGESKTDKLPTFFNTNNFYTNPSKKNLFTLSNCANLIIILLYLWMVGYPIISIQIKDGNTTINNNAIYCIATFAIIIILGQILYKYQKNILITSIKNEWKMLKDRIKEEE